MTEIQNLVDSFTAIGDPISICEHVDIIIEECVPENYESSVSHINNRSEPLTIDEIKTVLLGHEAQIDKFRKKAVVSVNVASTSTVSSVTNPPHANFGGFRIRIRVSIKTEDVAVFSVTSVRSLVMMLPTAGTGPQLPMLCSLSYVGTISHHASALFQFLWSCSAISLLSVYAGSCSSTNASSHYFCSTDYASANADYAATTPSSYLGSSSSNYTASVNSTNVYIQSYGLLQSSGHDYWFLM